MMSPVRIRVPAPLRQRSFRALWCAGLVSDTGDWLLLIALPVVVYQFTGSALGTAAAFIVELAPAVLLAPVVGRIVDRVDRRRLMLAVTPVQGVVLLALLLVRDRGDLTLLYVVIAVEAALMAVFEPAKNAMLPALVDGSDLVAANSLVGLNQNLGRLVGGPLGGVILAAGGLPAVVVADAVSYVVAFAFLLRLQPTAVDVSSRRVAGAEDAGWSVLRRRPVPTLLTVTFVSQVAQGLFVALFILFVTRRLDGGSPEIGLLRGVQAIGGLLGGVVVAAIGRRLSPGAMAALGIGVFGLLDLLIWNGPALTTAAWLYVLLFVAVGVPGIVYATGVITAMQQAAAAHPGRVFSAYGLAANLGQGIGLAAAGVLAGPVGLLTLLNGQAGLLLLTAAVAAAGLRARPAAGSGADRLAVRPVERLE